MNNEIDTNKVVFILDHSNIPYFALNMCNYMNTHHTPHTCDSENYIKIIYHFHFLDQSKIPVHISDIALTLEY